MRRPGTNPEEYKEKISRASRENSSRVILAVDIDHGTPEAGLKQARNLLNKTTSYLCGVKIGRQTILNLGTSPTAQITKFAHSQGLPCIIDDKLNDIGPTNTAIADAYFRLGFDALTANPFTGWKGGMEPLFTTAHKKGRGILLLVYMSHPGASEGYGQTVATGRYRRPQYVQFAEKAGKWKADGVIVGATRPNIVTRVRKILGETVPIYSPGVGVQGGSVKQALKAGTTYFIIGRSITASPEPEAAAAKFAQLTSTII